MSTILVRRDVRADKQGNTVFSSPYCLYFVTSLVQCQKKLGRLVWMLTKLVRQIFVEKNAKVKTWVFRLYFVHVLYCSPCHRRGGCIDDKNISGCFSVAWSSCIGCIVHITHTVVNDRCSMLVHQVLLDIQMNCDRLQCLDLTLEDRVCKCICTNTSKSQIVIELCYTLVVPQCLVLALVIGRVSTWNHRNHKLLLNFVLPHCLVLSLEDRVTTRLSTNQIPTPTLPYVKIHWNINLSKSQIVIELCCCQLVTLLCLNAFFSH